ncbi:MAG: anthranilate phosphoribosyltransferase, partial [Gallionella sp.]
MNFALTLTQLLDRRDLAHADMLVLMHELMSGALTPVQIAAVLIALRSKGESVTEIAAAATVMRE